MKHELPPLLSHPEPHSMTWTAMEGRAIAEYAQQVAEPLLARIKELEAQLASGQEPIAWFDEEMQSAYTRTELDGGAIEGLIPLYAHPAPAQQPLSDEQKQRIHDETGAGHALISLVELCIKEKP
jgi:hypothetical protein